MCDDSCPSDQVKIATEASGGFTSFSNGCIAGARAYCCKEPKPLVSRETDDPAFGGNQNSEFKLLLEDYMRNPTCPATIMSPTPNPGNTFINKRSLAAEATEHDILRGRAVDCYETHFFKMVLFAAALLTRPGGDSQLAPLESNYNNIFASSFDTQLVMANLRSYYNRIPSFDPNSLMRK